MSVEVFQVDCQLTVLLLRYIEQQHTILARSRIDDG